LVLWSLLYQTPTGCISAWLVNGCWTKGKRIFYYLLLDTILATGRAAPRLDFSHLVCSCFFIYTIIIFFTSIIHVHLHSSADIYVYARNCTFAVDANILVGSHSFVGRVDEDQEALSPHSSPATPIVSRRKRLVILILACCVMKKEKRPRGIRIGATGQSLGRQAARAGRHTACRGGRWTGNLRGNQEDCCRVGSPDCRTNEATGDVLALHFPNISLAVGDIG